MSVDLTQPTVVIEPRRGLLDLDLNSVWQYRELLYFLVWRDVKVRYKQTVLGLGWALLQPAMMMTIFTVVFSQFAKVPSDGLPYPLFALSALLPWTLFSEAISRSSVSVVSEANLVRKIYFPRLLMPLGAAITPLADFIPAFVLLLAMMLWYGVMPGWHVLALPLFLLFALATAFSVSLWLSAINVKYRDVKHTIPFLIQVWLYASPIAYPLSMVPENWRTLYSLNPMVGVVEGFRWGLLGHARPDFGAMAIGAGIVAALLIGGLIYFRNMEKTFADII